jgi:biofilm PGA synthesis N-glycosyltransferase PgaC
MGYVVVTPANNEERFIEKTICSMIHQTLRPLKWIVVDDASIDRTREIVSAYASQHSFIELLSLERPGRHFGYKAIAFNRGLAEARHIDYQYIGNLDADISLEPNYFESICREFEKDTTLGIAGGMVHTRMEGKFVSQETAPDSVAGPIQLFRRACFHQIGGFVALPNGGEDAAAEITARMNGWRVRTFPELHVLEHRRPGAATAGPLTSRLREGRRFHSLGYGLLFYLLRCLYRSMEPPPVLGSAVELIGYLEGLIGRKPILLSSQVVRYLRTEQRKKIVSLLMHSRRQWAER